MLPPLSDTLQQLAAERLAILDIEMTLSSQQEALLGRALALSDFIFKSIERYPQWLPLALEAEHYTERHLNYQHLLEAELEKISDEAGLHRVLRMFRQRESMLIAWRDFLNLSPIETSLAQISELAEVLIIGAYQWLYQAQCGMSGIPLDDNGEPMPMLIMGMGKLGGGELNFSSDVDLIFSYPQKGEIDRGRKTIEFQKFFTRLGQKLINALHQQTAHGFVYRTDMRLRPFGESGPLVVHFDAVEDYYQTQGREWERFAMVKGRILGADSAYHQQLQTLLKPFVFRRYLDFSAIESLRKMKRLIVQEIRRRGLINNIKLGQGGIREVEFIVQAFQLMRGGREPSLQDKSILTSLNAIAQLGLLEPDVVNRLRESYLYLRRVEHFLQQIDDQQTQTLPDDEHDQQRVAIAMGYRDYPQLLAELEQHTAYIHQQFRWLISDENDEQEQQNDCPLTDVWLGDMERIATLEVLQQYTEQGEEIYRLMGDFRGNLEKKRIGERGRETLDKLFPVMLTEILDYSQPEILLQRLLPLFNQILRRTTYLELLWEHPDAMQQLLKLCHASPWIADYLAVHPILLDELLDPVSLQRMPELGNYPELLRQFLLRIPEEDVEMQMDGLRQFKQIHQLRIAAADVSGILPLMEVSDHLTQLAATICQWVLHMAWQQMVDKYGSPQTLEAGQPDFTIVAYGKFGGVELGYGSDLDLVFLYDGDGKATTDGAKSVSTQQFYVKMAQRILHIFSARTSAGQLYDVDMRLRPSGESGLLVSHIDSYQTYLAEDAWTWEHQALTRTQSVGGIRQLQDKFSNIRRDVIRLPRATKQLAEQVCEMREKMRKHLDKSTAELVDVKQGGGCITDIEFITQYLVLANAAVYEDLAFCSDNIRSQQALKDAGLLTAKECKQLNLAYIRLRDESHKAALGNTPNLMPKDTLLKERANVQQIWQRVFGS